MFSVGVMNRGGGRVPGTRRRRGIESMQRTACGPINYLDCQAKYQAMRRLSAARVPDQVR